MYNTDCFLATHKVKKGEAYFMYKLLDQTDLRRAKELEELLCDDTYSFGEPYYNREAWENGFSPEMKGKIVLMAEEELKKPEYVITEEIACLYKIKGDRKVSDSYHHGAVERITVFALAECIENGGRFITAYEKAVSAYCQFNSWVLTAHDYNMENYYLRNITIDLHSSCGSWELVIADYIMNDKVNPLIRSMIRENINKRTLEPFLAILEGKKEAPKWLDKTTNNWNAVCLGAVMGSAFGLIESKQLRSIFLVAWEKYIKNYKNGFSGDGYCSEGLGYWSYGFSHYIFPAELIRQATNGILDYMNLPDIANDAVFPIKMHMGSGVYPSIGDCRIGFVPEEQPVKYVKSRYYGEDIGICECITRLYSLLVFAFDKFSHLPKLNFNTEKNDIAYRSWFSDAGVLVSRCGLSDDCKLSACMKGGNNNEHHNHNDIGSFTISVNDIQLISDIGNECYSAKTFSEHRYESSFFNSYGHSVPVIGGKLQGCEPTKRKSSFFAKTLHVSFSEAPDKYRLDLSNAYDCTYEEIKSLTREFVYDRSGKGSLTVTDIASFDTEMSFGTAILTYGIPEIISDNIIKVELGGQAVEIEIVCNKSIAVSSEILYGDIAYLENFYKDLTPTRIDISVTEPAKEITLVCIIRAIC